MIFDVHSTFLVKFSTLKIRKYRFFFFFLIAEWLRERKVLTGLYNVKRRETGEPEGVSIMGFVPKVCKEPKGALSLVFMA